MVHHLALQQALKNGLTLTKIHRGIKYDETTFLKKYIDLNTNLQKASKNGFNKDFFKLMVNSIFGKTMENIRCRSNVRIVNEKNKRKLLGLISQPNLKSVYRYENSDLVLLNVGKSFVTLNKPIYLGQAILDTSKTLMYDFHHGYIREKYGDRARLLMRIRTRCLMKSRQKIFTTIFETMSLRCLIRPITLQIIVQDCR